MSEYRILRQNCEWLIKTVIVYLAVILYKDTYGNSRANTCLQARLHGRAAVIRSRTDPGFPGLKMIHSKRENRYMRLANQVSDLSASDGRVLAYRGFDG